MHIILEVLLQKVNQIQFLDNIVTDNAQRDVSSVKDAYKYYQELISTFPDSKYSEEAKNKLKI